MVLWYLFTGVSSSIKVIFCGGGGEYFKATTVVLTHDHEKLSNQACAWKREI